MLVKELGPHVNNFLPTHKWQLCAFQKPVKKFNWKIQISYFAPWRFSRDLSGPLWRQTSIL